MVMEWVQCLKRKFKAYLGSRTSAHLIKSRAVVETSEKSSEGKVSEHCEIFRYVSCLESPPKGE